MIVALRTPKIAGDSDVLDAEVKLEELTPRFGWCSMDPVIEQV